jgi:hypothetical protein
LRQEPSSQDRPRCRPCRPADRAQGEHSPTPAHFRGARRACDGGHPAPSWRSCGGGWYWLGDRSCGSSRRRCRFDLRRRAPPRSWRPGATSLVHGVVAAARLISTCRGRRHVHLRSAGGVSSHHVDNVDTAGDRRVVMGNRDGPCTTCIPLDTAGTRISRWPSSASFVHRRPRFDEGKRRPTFDMASSSPPAPAAFRDRVLC